MALFLTSYSLRPAPQGYLALCSASGKFRSLLGENSLLFKKMYGLWYVGLFYYWGMYDWPALDGAAGVIPVDKWTVTPAVEVGGQLSRHA